MARYPVGNDFSKNLISGLKHCDRSPVLNSVPLPFLFCDTEFLLLQVKRLKDVYKFDDAFNYKTEDCNSFLKKCFPNGIDLYFDNVGGHMLEAALENMKNKGRISACGMISQYNEEHIEHYAVRNLMRIVGKSLRVEGFLISDYLDTWDAFFKEIGQYIREGKINYDTTVLGRGIEEFPQALVRMFRGENMGKSVLFVSNE
ncbi:hypothetical protein KP509_1Z138800 [Ceratopteris richardii]|nr:hypothetical protein KP509_1Z138800 [Ceratopteris richardii]